MLPENIAFSVLYVSLTIMLELLSFINDQLLLDIEDAFSFDNIFSINTTIDLLPLNVYWRNLSLFSSAYSSPGRGCSIFSREAQNALSMATSTSSSDAEMLRPDEKCHFREVFCVSLRVSSRVDMPQTPPQEAIQEASCPDAQETSTGSSWCGVALLWASCGCLSSSPHL